MVRGRKPGPTLDQVRAFCAVAEEGSYRRAAERLEVDQHVALIRLVDRLAIALKRERLINADSRGNAFLTSSGRDLLPAARRYMAAAEAIVQLEVAVRLSAYPTIASRLVADSPQLFDGRFPLELYEVGEDARLGRGRSLVRDVETGILDLAIAPAGLATGTVHERKLYRWSLRVLLPGRSKLADEKPDTLTPDELNRFRIAAAPSRHTSRDQLEAAYHSENVELQVSLESSSQELLRVLAANSDTYAAVVPDDAYGAPDQDLGPRLVTQNQADWGGLYSLYARTDMTDVHIDEAKSEASALETAISAVVAVLQV